MDPLRSPWKPFGTSFKNRTMNLISSQFENKRLDKLKLHINHQSIFFEKMCQDWKCLRVGLVLMFMAGNVQGSKFFMAR